jgi:hypothetical protein
MLVASTNSQFGDATPSTVQMSRVASTGQQLAEVEVRLRNSFGRLAVALSAYERTKTKAPSQFISLLERFNVAQSAYEEAANFWLIARADTPRDQLPDPDRVPEKVPKFDLSKLSQGLASWGLSTGVDVSKIGVIYGPWYQPKRTNLSGYWADQAANGNNGLGVITIPVMIFVIALVAITGAVLISIFGKSQAAASIAANEAATAKAQARLAEVESDERMMSALVAQCLGRNPSDEQRVKCTTDVMERFPGLQQGRPDTSTPQPSDSSIGFFATVGILTVLGAAGTAGYFLYRRRQRQGFAELPSARARSRRD